ncbi:Phosphohistidine phosphatase SixA [Fulvimarina manganoxydans]|uniref:Phosphohistidine phosphatase SixA n=1 Tax=Fulvimarina manganoxydans TaxID=937218 RepID=A0A1W2CIG0_9HYPH|nr:histidine phosphatase family protein [Fulvimarina manganoxydans]SMC84970.1 Phosphohistidine phosphatase SixA [Fulvimarina manganoxydans]
MTRILNHFAALFCAVVFITASLGNGKAQDDPYALAREPGIHLLMRHAIAPGTGDPANFELGDCSTQRNLSDEGRRQAEAIGARLKDNGVPIDVVLTSQWCRSRDTADRLSVAPVEDAPFLNSFFRDRGSADAQTQDALARIEALDAAGEKAVLVTHQVNITALTDVFPRSGEIILVSRNENGDLESRGRITP